MKGNRARILVASGLVISAAATAAVALANTGNTTSLVLGARSTLSDDVQLNDERIKFQTKDPTDLMMQQVTFPPLGTSGWHHHPGVILVLVKSGQVVVHDANCQTRTYGPNQAFVEHGTAPLMVSNPSTVDPAVDLAAQVAPQGSPFRIEDDPPACAVP
jgi:quercetin dioxygenase-like cupin family protein